jgi:hypothetical protein
LDDTPKRFRFGWCSDSGGIIVLEQCDLGRRLVNADAGFRALVSLKTGV